jgi:pSer/pThr/pTyr-binding forkhead associated (FHA) protein
MIQFKILSGKQAGAITVARRFPFRVGRAADADLMLEEPGVWDAHCQIEFDRSAGFLACPQGDALLTVNGQSVQAPTRLRNGDSLELGGARLQFWLGETRPSGFRLREWLVWGGIALVTLAQVAIVYRLLHQG